MKIRPCLLGAILILGGCSKEEANKETQPNEISPAHLKKISNSKAGANKVSETSLINENRSAELLKDIDFGSSELKAKEIAEYLKLAGPSGLATLAERLKSSSLSIGMSLTGAEKFGEAIRIFVNSSEIDPVSYFKAVGSAFEQLPNQLRDEAIKELSGGITKHFKDTKALLADYVNGSRIPGLRAANYGEMFYHALVSDMITQGKAAELLDMAMSGNGTAADKNEIVRSAIGVWAYGQSLEASEYVSQMPGGSQRDTAIQALVKTVMDQGDFEAAQIWIDNIKDPFIKEAMLGALAQKTKTNP